MSESSESSTLRQDRILLPEEQTELLLRRQRIIRECQNSEANQQAVLAICATDPIFFINMFGWVYEPRASGTPDNPKERPFLLWEFQKDCVTAIVESIQIAGTGHRADIVIDKSRGMGISWTVIYTHLHQWLFVPGFKTTWASLNEEKVDKADEPDCLFWKLYFALQRLPEWMIPNYKPAHMKLLNEDNGSVIGGEASTGDVGRGGRATTNFFDEFQEFEKDGEAWTTSAGNTNCRIVCGTAPKRGMGAQFAKCVFDPNIIAGTIGRKLVYRWWQNPIMAKDSYKDENGKLRSPWYDEMKIAIGSPRAFAQEVEGDYTGATAPFFDMQIISDHGRVFGRPALSSGELTFTADTNVGSIAIKEFKTDGKKRLRLWCKLVNGQPDREHQYTIGVDVSPGTGASNTVITVGDVNERRVVAKFVDSNIPPHEAAQYATALALWFRRAFLIWESTGPGLQFGKEIGRFGYGNIYYQRKEELEDPKDGQVPGWHTNRTSKELLLSELRAGYAKSEIENPCLDALEEYKGYVYMPNGALDTNKTTDDPSGARTAHGDHVISDGLVFLGFMARPADVRITNPEQNPPEFSLAWHRRMRAEKEQEKDVMWSVN